MLNILKNHTILYVEDEPQIQANITEYLESYFATVYVASDGKEGLSLYEEHHPDVLILDINLPYFSGLEIAKKVRQKDQAVKIVMLTAHTEQEKLLAATELKLTKYLIKPLAPKLFKETMHLLVQELRKNPSVFVNLSATCVWNKKQEVLRINDIRVLLTEKEQRLLKLLIEHKNTTVSCEDIMVTVWEDALEKEISHNSVKNQISHLRKKLPDVSIDAVYGEGYRLQ
ncbi:MAG TPA: response regulator transcription factor [Epsilonproteobacteria bacterium]|nr:response regulator transcription factor [Campylobacterota bacterium]